MRDGWISMASFSICCQSGRYLSLNPLQSKTVKGTTMFGLVLVQITSRSDSRNPVMNWPKLQLLHRWVLPTGVPFFTFSLLMSVDLLNPASCRKLQAGEQAITGFAVLCHSSYRNSRSGRDSNPRPPAPQGEVSRHLRHRPR